MAVTSNPLPDSGVVGKLTKTEQAALKQFWVELFKLIDEAPVQGANSPGDASDAAKRNADAESAKNAPKDDSSKEKQRQNEEMQNARLAFEQYGSRRFMQTFWRFVAMDHPDSLCLKFLRARKWNPTAGLAMFAACMKWRIESGVEDVFAKGEEGLQHGEGFLHQIKSGKAYLHGSDRSGRPVFYVHARMHKTSEQSPKALEDFVLFQMESLRCLAHGTVEKVTMVFDLTGFGLANMDWRCLWFIVKCLESYYPESLNCICVYNPPWVFNGIWKVVSPALDPQVRAKVQLPKSPEELAVHIPLAHLPPSLGGQNKWEWKYPSIVDGENAAMKDETTRESLQKERDGLARQFEELTRAWANASGETAESNEREVLAMRLRTQYFDLDPYIRGRGAYHRLGNIVGNGLVSFQYPGAQGTEAGEYEVLGWDGCKESLQVRLGISDQDKQPRAAKVANGQEIISPTSAISSTPSKPTTNGPTTNGSSSLLASPSSSRHAFLDKDPSPSQSPVGKGLSRQSTRSTVASSDTRGANATSNSSPAGARSTSSKKSSKLRRRLTSIRAFGSMRSLQSNEGEKGQSV